MIELVTKHAQKRLKQREGIGRSAAERKAQMALEKGYTHTQTKGKLKKWMDGKFLSYGTVNNMRVYGDKLYCFHDDVLITVLQIPQVIVKNLKDYIINE